MDQGRYKIPCTIFLSICLFLLFALQLVQVGDANAATAKDRKSFWCCAGWSDDLSLSPPQVETTQCDTNCIGKTYCNGSGTGNSGSGFECATMWQCDVYHSKNVTAAQCVDPKEADGACYCNSDWCNCPKNLQGIKTKQSNTRKSCCDGQSDDTSTITIDDRYGGCLGRISENVTVWSADYSREYELLSRLREDCYEWTFKKYGFDGEGICRCKNGYCNCPPDIKEKNKKRSQANKIYSCLLVTRLILIFIPFFSPLTCF